MPSRPSLSRRLAYRLKRSPLAARAYQFLTTVFAPAYNEDGMRLHKNPAFLTDPDFRRAYAAALRQEPGTRTRWRARTTQWAARRALEIEGDFVECGVNKAFFAASAMEFVNFKTKTDRTFYLFDTFEGVASSQVGEGERAAFKNEYSDTLAFVRETFKDYENVRIVKGVVPDSLREVEIERVAYLSIDMNVAYPERAALEFFWDKLTPGATVTLDDYGFPGRDAQRRAADEFAASRDRLVLPLPTGQGLLIK
jgi:hypothetical protein